MSAFPEWTDEEIGEVQGLAHLPAKKAAEILGRSTKSIYHVRSKLRRGWVPRLSYWSDDEIEVARKSTNLTTKQVADKLGRTATQVQWMRAKLRKDEGLDFTRNQYSWNPFWVGTRRLLAKTCLGCGLLLDASRFCEDGSRRWRTKCSLCTSTSRTGRYRTRPTKEVANQQVRESRTRLQNITSDRATRSRFPWLESDHVVLRDTTLSCFEKAIALSRTYYSVTNATRKYGYTSRVEKGDPMQGVWHIDNPNDPKQKKAA